MSRAGRTFWDFLLIIMDYPVVQFAIGVLSVAAAVAIIGMVVPR